MRPVIKLKQGFPESLTTPHNELFYAEDHGRGLVIFLGDEPQLDIERYSAAFLRAAQTLGVKRIIGLGGVYGELPYDKERMISCMYSLPGNKEEISRLAVHLSDYEGGATVESYICRRAAEQEIDFTAFYAFVPAYNISIAEQIGNTIRIENDFSAWLDVMRRISYMFRLGFDLTDLEGKSKELVETLDSKVEEIDRLAPQLEVREYLRRVAADFTEMPFNPLDEVWDEEIRRILHKFDDED